MTNHVDKMQAEMQARANQLWAFMHRPGVAPGDRNWTRWAGERRSLLRVIHDIPQACQLPLDWQP